MTSPHAQALRLRAVFVTVFLVAACGLGYELVAGTVASYFLGDSVTQFSVAIGLYLFALGLGAWLSRFLVTRLVDRFVDVELAVALLGGTLAAVLHLAFGTGRWFRPVLYGEILAVGTLVGLEIPLLLRILKDDLDFKDLVGKVLSFDYVGSLAVSLAFPLLLLPRLHVIRSSLLLGFVNAFVALWTTYLFEHRLVRPTALRIRCGIALAVLVTGMALAERVQGLGESSYYDGEVVHTVTSPYQRIALTRDTDGFRLYLNGALQFASTDEARYHEALVHPAMATVAEPRRVLVLGGGDGLAVREVLKHPSVERVTLVDIDPAVTDLATSFPLLVAQNRGALSDPRVKVVNDDALAWLRSPEGLHDVAIVDFPDPESYSTSKLYTQRFYELLGGALAKDGAFAVQATSVLSTKKAYWCIVKTIEAAGFTALPYRQFVPSFRGDWGFVLAARRGIGPPPRLLPGLVTLDDASARAMFTLPPDLRREDVEVNRLDSQVLVRYYEEEVRR